MHQLALIFAGQLSFRRSRYRGCWLGIAILCCATGCASTQYVKVRGVPKNPLAPQLQLAHHAEATDRTLQVLRQYNLVGELHGDSKKLVHNLQAIVERDPSAEKLYAVSELSYRAARKAEAMDSSAALHHYGTSVAYAYLYLFDRRFAHLRNPYDPQFRGASELYNGALEGMLRLVKRHGGLLPGRTFQIESGTQQFDVAVKVQGSTWTEADFAELKFVGDYEVRGLANQHVTYGLGVPLVAVRRRPNPPTPADHYYPDNLAFPITAFLRLLPDENCSELRPGQRHRAVLELCDPMVSTDIALGGQRVPLETDLSTPLAYFLNLNHKRLEDFATYGLLRPDREEALTGLYMLQPYQPGKIPVVMVHGLWSSPLTWTEMFNDLRGEAEIRDRYQIMFYLYPTGEPFWNAATRMRRDLAQLRTCVDPDGREPALDQMVLVGHSMGGLVSKMQTLDSRDDFWRLESDQPFEVVQASYEERQQLEQLFFFRPNSSVKRVVTIATPHRGSKFANDTTRYLAQKLITLPQVITQKSEVIKKNPGVFRDTTLVSITTSLDSLAPSSPVLPWVLNAEHPNTVRYHNIVGLLPDRGLTGYLTPHSDGVVAYESAHLDDVASEITVPSDHSNVHRHPLAVLEVRRILLEHLRELQATGSISFPAPPAPTLHPQPVTIVPYADGPAGVASGGS